MVSLWKWEDQKVRLYALWTSMYQSTAQMVLLGDSDRRSLYGNECTLGQILENKCIPSFHSR
jgi:hypothetical protein